MKKLPVYILLSILVVATPALAGITKPGKGGAASGTQSFPDIDLGFVPKEFGFAGGYADGKSETLIYCLRGETPKSWTELLTVRISREDVSPRKVVLEMRAAFAKACPEGEASDVADGNASAYFEAYCPVSPATGRAEAFAVKGSRVGQRSLFIQRSMSRKAGLPIPEAEWLRDWVMGEDRKKQDEKDWRGR